MTYFGIIYEGIYIIVILCVLCIVRQRNNIVVDFTELAWKKNLSDIKVEATRYEDEVEDEDGEIKDSNIKERV